MKSLNSFAPGKGKREAQESERVNNYDQPSQDNPNAMGRTMRPLVEQCAGRANYPADAHDLDLSGPYPKIQRGAVATGAFGAKTDRKDGAGGGFTAGY